MNGLPSSRIALLLSLIAIAPIAAGAQPASMVRDIDPLPPDPAAGAFNPQSIAVVTAGSRLYFSASSGSSGFELWRTDGTPLGTRQVAELCPGPCDSSPQPVGSHGEIALFATASSEPDPPPWHQVWRTDGTRAGTYPLTSAGMDYVFPALYADGEAVYFSLCDRGDEAAKRCELWRSDGTRAGTLRILGGPDIGEIGPVHRIGGKLVVVSDDRSQALGLDLWVSDGTAAGTHRVAVVPYFYPVAAAADRFLWINSVQGQFDELWSSDGTAAGTRALMRFQPRDYYSAYRSFQSAGGKAYLPLDDGVHGLQLWVTDGTVSGTRRISDFAAPQALAGFTSFNTASAGGRLVFQAADAQGVFHLFATDGGASPPVQLPAAVSGGGSMVTVGGRAVLFADDGVHGVEPWSTDGTVAGTAMIADLCPGACSTQETVVYSTPGDAIFGTGENGHTADLWTTDGTAAGTSRLTDFAPGQAPVVDEILSLVGSRIFFLAEDAVHGKELWVADGKAGGSHPVGEIGIGESSSDPSRLSALAGRLFFTACDGTTRDVWSSAGTAATTSPIGGPPARSGCADDDATADRSLTPAGGAVYFLRAGDGGEEIWRTDGTSAGTAQVPGYPQIPAPFPDSVGDLVAFQDAVWLDVQTANHTEIWRADGAGARSALSFDETVNAVESLSAVGPRLFFFAGDAEGTALFASDGTPAGTQRLGGPFSPSRGPQPPPVPRFVTLGAASFFVAQSLVDGQGELWKTDGTAAGTRFVHDVQTFPATPLAAAGTALYFFAAPPPGSTDQVALWRSDGTPAGTVPIRSFPALSFRDVLAAVGDRIYFTVDDGVHGDELWTSDGSAAGTHLVADLFAGILGSNPHDLTPAGGLLYFGAGDEFHGDELWVTDGTAAGTHLVQDIAPEEASSSPDHLLVVGDRLYFVADDGLHGRELWSLPLSGGPATCAPAADHLCLAGGRFAVTAEWRDFQGGAGKGTAVALSADTGYFWFFDPANVEVVTKVLDGRSLNQAFWVFYGALSTVEYALTVTDVQTGLARRYVNPSGELASVADTDGFGPLGAAERAPARSLAKVRHAAPAAPIPTSMRTDPRAATGTCTPAAGTLCLGGRPLRGDGVVERFPGPHRRRHGGLAHRRHRLLLVLRSRQRRGGDQGPRRPRGQRKVLALLRRALLGRVHAHRLRHRDRRRQDVQQCERHPGERRRHQRLLSRGSRSQRTPCVARRQQLC